MTEPKKCEVRAINDHGTHVPWGVFLGKIQVSRHAEEADAQRIADKLNFKIERRVLLDVVAKIRDGIRAES